MNNRKFLLSLGAALATSRLARAITSIDADNVLGTVGLERHRSHAWQNFAVFSVGALAGAGAALLLAPMTGRETRQRLSGQIDRLATAANEAVQEVKNEAPALISRVTPGQTSTTAQPTEARNRHS